MSEVDSSRDLSRERFIFSGEQVAKVSWIQDANGRFFGENPSWTDRTGQSVDDSYGLSWTNAVYPADIGLVMQPYINPTGSLRRSFVRLMDANSGTHKWVEWIIMPMTQNDKIEGWYGAAIDVHDKVLAMQTLEQQKQESDENIQRLLERVDQWDHENRPYPTIVLGTASILMRTIANLGNDAIDSGLGEIVLYSEHNIEINKSLVDIVAGREPELIPANPKRIIQRAVEIFRIETFKERPVKIEIPEDVDFIQCNEGSIYVVLRNLLNNAHKYSNDGSTIVVSATQGGGEIKFSVQDEGVGMPKEDLDKVFTQGFRIELSKAVAAGRGIGLATAKSIVESHGGKIWVESEPGKGSTFYFTLPEFHDELLESNPNL
ncbi:MAG TPA: PAS domain-containing sensor histidine kinase [Candidatus Saccharimonadales bacterium]|nr:PAS domain-containing sensor histidine kinase [Candidatus Saccharimonadales bacterium]